MVAYRPRMIDRSVASALSTFGALIIEGPRAVGKTTTASQHAQSYVR